jgi:hypothetical protein
VNESTAKSLAAKMAAMDLTYDEAALLVVLMGGTVESEVSGFTFDTNRMEEYKVTYSPIIGTGIGTSHWFVADSFSFAVEREMKHDGP